MDLFNMWQLPDRTRSRIFRQVDPADMFFLSNHSSHVNRFLMAYKLYASRLVWQIVKATDGEREAGQPEEIYRIQLHFPEPDKRVYFFCAQRHEQDLRIVENKIISYTPEALKEYETVSKHLLEIFHIEKFEFYYESHPKFSPFEDNFIWNLTRKFDSFKIFTLAQITEENVRFLTENLEIDSLTLYLSTFLNRLPLSNIQFNVRRELNLYSCDWITLDDVLNAKSEKMKIQFWDENGPNSNCLRIVETWMSGEKLTDMKEMNVTFEDEVAHEQLMEQIDKLDGVERLTDQDAPNNKRKVTRITDGKIAEIEVGEKSLKILVE